MATIPPQAPGRTLLIGVFARTQGIELVEVQREHGQDGADLDDHQEQRKKLRGNLELDEIVDENHVARR